MTALNTLTVQGKAGAFTLSDMASHGERLFAAASRFDITGMERFNKFGALIQVARMGTGSSDQAATAIERILDDIISKHKTIKKLTGVEIFKDKNKTELKEMDEIIKGIIVGAKGNKTVLQRIFGVQATRGISVLAEYYKQTNGFDLFDRLSGVDAEKANELMNDFARYSKEAAPQLRALSNLARRFADASLAPTIRNAADALESITADPERMEEIAASINTMAKALSGLARGTLWVAEGWAKLLGLWEKGADFIANSIYMTGDNDLRSGNMVDQFNSLPADIKKDAMDRLKRGEPVNLEFEVMRYKTRMRKQIAEGNGNESDIKAETTVNVTVHSDGHVEADTTAKGGRATTRIDLARGVSPLVRITE